MTVSAYKWMDVAEDGSHNLVYSWTSEAADWVRTNYPSYIGTEADNSVQTAFTTANAGTKASFYDAAAEAIKDGALTITPTTRTGAGNIENLTIGNYLILIGTGMNIYRPSAVNLVPEWDDETGAWSTSITASVDVKFSEPTLTKTVMAPNTQTGKEADNANIGDTITYDIVADVPQYSASASAKNYAISDSLPSGLTLNEGSIQVWGKSRQSETPLQLTTDYAQSEERPNSGGVSTFTLTFVYDQISACEKIHIQYTAVLNSEAALGETGNVNTAYLDYGQDDNSWKMYSDSANVYTYGLDVNKVDEDDNSVLLPGAQFELYASQEDAVSGDNKIQFVMTEKGEYRRALSTDTVESIGTTLTVGDGTDSVQGNLIVRGLDEGTWYLKEITAPEGYNLLTNPIAVTIKDAADATNVLDGKVESAKGSTGEDVALVTLTVENNNDFQLPTTGGIGTVVFTAVGVILMGTAAVLVIVAIKMKKSEG